MIVGCMEVSTSINWTDEGLCYDCTVTYKRSEYARPIEVTGKGRTAKEAYRDACQQVRTEDTARHYGVMETVALQGF
jgi:hypothetical protein